jgi:hypothetical protein
LVASTRASISASKQSSPKHSKEEFLDYIDEGQNLLPLKERIKLIKDKTGCLIRCLTQDKNLMTISYHSFSHGNDRDLQLEIKSIVSLVGQMFSPKEKYCVTILYPKPSHNIEGLDQPELLTMELPASLVYNYITNKISFNDLWKDIRFFVKESNTYYIRTREIGVELVI